MIELVIITEITVIKFIHRRNSMEKKTEKDKETKEQTLRNWSRKYAQKYFLLIMSQTQNGDVKIATKRKNLKTMGHRTLFMDHYPRNGQMRDTDPLFRYVMVAKVISIT